MHLHGCTLYGCTCILATGLRVDSSATVGPITTPRDGVPAGRGARKAGVLQGDAKTEMLRAAVESAGGTWRDVAALSEAQVHVITPILPAPYTFRGSCAKVTWFMSPADPSSAHTR